MSFLASAQRTFANQSAALTKLSDRLDDSFSNACELLMQCTGKVVVSGMGKSGHIANKIAATLASTGTPAFFMHPGEANHGDLGMVAKNDIVIAISNSGESHEVVGILASIKRLNVPIIAITNKSSSSLAKYADVVLTLGVEKEACALGLAPTTSTTATLVLGDAIAIALLEAKGFTADDFAFSHPGGALGKRLLLTVNDVMCKREAMPLVGQDANLKQALLEVSSKGIGMTGVTDNQGALVGIFTDGDLRRALDKQADINNTQVTQVMTAGGISVNADTMAIDALNIMQENRISSLFAVDEKQHPQGALSMYMLLNAGVI